MFTEIFENYDFRTESEKIKNRTIEDVEQALSNALQGRMLFDDYLSLLSPSADRLLTEMAELARRITRQRFGNIMQIYIPLYLSNECRSSCLYCGYSFENKLPRITLAKAELTREAEIIHSKGIRQVLALTGEDYSRTPVSYIADSVSLLNSYFPSVSIEIYPMDTDNYSTIINAGAEGLALYQETYHPENYKTYHIRGMKKNMKYRLEGPDRGGTAGFRRISIGALLGLSDSLGEMFFLGLHAEYLQKKYWKSLIQVSLPRLKHAEGNFSKEYNVTDREFLRFIFALRIYFNDLGITLSTRERPELRDAVIQYGITSVSAESKTEPGGYQGIEALEQFETEDKRTVSEIKDMIRRSGLDPVFKDFDRGLNNRTAD